MNRPLHNTEQRANKVPNYAQAAAKSQQPQQQQQQQLAQQQQPTRGHQPQHETEQPSFVKSTGPTYNKSTGGHSQYHGHKNSYNNNSNSNSNRKETPYVNRKASVQLPMPPPTDTAPIQFGSINQPSSSSNPSLPVAAATSTQQPIPVVRAPANAQFGSSPAVNDIRHRPPPPSTSNQIRQSPQQQQQQLKEIPRSPRTTNDGRLFTQPYAPRRDFNQGDHYSSNNRYNNNSNNNNNNYNNNGYRNNGYARPPPPHHSPNQPYHPVQYSPQQMPHQQNLPPSPMSHRASPNMNTYNNNNTKKNNTNISPHIPHSSPQQNIQMAAASWSPAGQYFYPQYPVSVSSYNVPPTATRPPIIPPPTTRKRIAIIDPNTGVALNTNPMHLTSSSTSPSHHHHPSPHKEEKHLDFVKPPHTSKAVSIVDPAIRDRELREKREREEAEQEALRKAEEEKKEAERKAAEEKERLEKERLEAERLEAERIKEEERKKEADRLEAERLENERQKEAERKEAERVRLAEEASAIAVAALEKKKQEEELRRKAEEEKESKRVISELEAEKKRQEEASVQKVGRVPSKLEMPANPLTQSPASSPVHSDSKKPQQPMKVIEDFSAVHYPAGIQSPGAQDNKKHVYSIDFLLQFQQLCLDTDQDLSAINFKEMDAHSRSGSMRQPSDRGGGRGGPRTPGASNLTGDTMFKMNSRDGRMEMGKFNMGRPLTGRNNSSHMERQGSHGGSGRGGGSMRGGRGGGGSGMKVIRNPAILNQQGAPTIPMEQVAPLEKTENRWVPTVASQVAQPPAEGELMSQEYITRKVNALLNKLTMERFDSISAQIFEYARQSAKENDGRSLRTVMKLTFEKACDEPAFANMWARLCRSMYDAMTDDIKDTSILDENNKPSSGILLFRKYLFNRCQVEFEKGWKVNMPEVDEVDGMMTEEYYIAAKAKRQGLGLIQFIGELFKLEMLSERIMYGCMIKLCNDPTNAGDEEAESLCKLLTTIGKALDSKPKTAKWVDIVIQRMKNEMVLSPKLTSRVKFMIQDLVDLRKDKWVPRIGGNQVGPTTIAKIHEMAEKAKEEKEAAAAAMKRNNSSRGQFIPNNNHNMARGNSYRGNSGGKDHFNSNNNSSIGGGGDGWNTVATGANNKSRPTDLSNFGKTDRSRSRTNILGPSNSPFPSLSRGKSATNMDTKNMDGRSSPATNMFSALLNGSGGDKPEERKKLTLAPKSSTTAETSSAEKAPKLSDEAIKRKCKNIIEEYQSIRDKKELVECVKELDDPDYLVAFIGEMLTVVEKKAQDVDDMCKTIEYLNSENLLQKGLYVKAFKQFMEGYDDLTIDVPQAPKYVAQLMLASSVSPEEVGGDEYDSLQKAYKTLMESN
ncbi:eukaryotic initiation factor 4F subunit P130 [Mucor ambiguus]|uniref:Eukaryotic initiation factor 4F subunit P130 n=1 Tax=Mucor ambiguus TaxID=91626 RepID=A0A0C9MJT9_9FUNG|nr:eukaryotic initiation factor 4F subunit P130 [Mucor ambiguus]